MSKGQLHTKDKQIENLNVNVHKQTVHIKCFFHTSEFQKGLSAIMELILFEILHLEEVKDICLLITLTFLIAEMVA